MSHSNPARRLEFNSQWDDTMVNVMRDVVTQVNDSDRDLGAVKGAIERKWPPTSSPGLSTRKITTR